jgi:hypothetical protein
MVLKATPSIGFVVVGEATGACMVGWRWVTAAAVVVAARICWFVLLVEI